MNNIIHDVKNAWLKPNDRMEGPVMYESLDLATMNQAALDMPRDSSQSLPPCHKADNKKEWEIETIFFDAQLYIEKAITFKCLHPFLPEILSKYSIMLMYDNNWHKERSLKCLQYLDPYTKWIKIGIG